jgi:hypothetical protein
MVAKVIQIRPYASTKATTAQSISGTGYQVRHDMYGFYLLTDEEAAHEDDGNSSVGFDMRLHYTTMQEAIDGFKAGDRPDKSPAR